MIGVKFDKPNKAEELWRESVRSLDCLLTGSPAEIHHAVGRTAKHNKIEIGHHWIIPLSTECHRWIHQQGKLRKPLEKILFRQVLAQIQAHSECDLPSPEVIRAIFDYRR